MLEGREGYVYLLFEHKSYPDRLIHLQLIEYMLKIWRMLLKQKTEEFLPVIIPMVLYHGQRKWQYGTKFSSLFSEHPGRLDHYIPDFEFVLRDLTQYSDDEIRGTVLCRVVMLLFRHIYDPDIAEKLPGIFSLMKDLIGSEGGLRFFEKILRYLSNAADGIALNQIKRIVEESLSQEKGGLIMTIAEMMRKEGFEQGIRQGIQQGIQESIRESIEFGLNLRFGYEWLEIMPLIHHIQDYERLRSVRDAIKTAKDLSELKNFIGN